VLPGESFPAEISHEQVLALLGRDISKCEDSIARYVSAALNQNQHDALASFTFNCGGGALEKSSLRAKLNRGDYVGAADGLLAWCKAGGKDNTGLLNRRKAERALFLAPVAAPPPIEVTPFDLQQLVNVAPHA
jgi:lysozyme